MKKKTFETKYFLYLPLIFGEQNTQTMYCKYLVFESHYRKLWNFV